MRTWLLHPQWSLRAIFVVMVCAAVVLWWRFPPPQPPHAGVSIEPSPYGSFTYQVYFPDGTIEIYLDLPRRGTLDHITVVKDGRELTHFYHYRLDSTIQQLYPSSTAARVTTNLPVGEYILVPPGHKLEELELFEERFRFLQTLGASRGVVPNGPIYVSLGVLPDWKPLSQLSGEERDAMLREREARKAESQGESP